MSSFLSKRLALAVISIISAPVGAATVFEVNTFQDGADVSQGGTCATATGACSLRAAIQEANYQASTGPHTIKLPAGTYNLSLQGSDDGAAMGDLDINSSMTIEGFGADKTTIQVLNPPAGTDYRVFHVGATSTSPLVTIKGVTIKGGQSSQGAGIYLQTGTLDLVDSQVDSNFISLTTSSGGAGIYTNATLKIKNSSIANNQANNNTSGVGGAIYIGSGALRTEITNSTIYKNTVFTSQGAGIYSASTAPLIIASSTIFGNSANGANAAGVGLFGISGASAQLKNSILAGSLSNSSPATDCAGAISTGGYNLIGLAPTGLTCIISNPTSALGDQVGATAGSPLSPNLGQYQANSGTISSLMPAGAPVVDVGNPAGCTAADGTLLIADQRGYLRQTVATGTPGVAGRCDIGAVEANSSYSATSGGSGVGPVASALSFTAYASTNVSGSLAGANPDLLKAETSQSFTVPSCPGSPFATVGSASGLIFCVDNSVAWKVKPTINQSTGYFTYEPGTNTGNDSFAYFVQNSSGQRAIGVVSINISTSGPTALLPPIFPAAGLALSVKPGNKIRTALPFVDADTGTAVRYTVSVPTQPQKGAATIVFNNGQDNANSSHLEYIPNDGAVGTDSFVVNVSDGAASGQLAVTVNIGTTPTVAPALVALGAVVKDDISRTQPTILNDFSSVLRNPSGLTVTVARFADPVSGSGAALGSVVSNNGVVTYTPPTSLSSAENRAIFRINASYFEAGVAKTLTDVPVTLNFAAPGASTIPVPNQFNSPATVPRTGAGYSGGLFSSFTPPSGATSIVYEVSATSGGTFGSSASSSFGRVDVTSGAGVFTYTVLSSTPVSVSQDTLYYRVRYTDLLSAAITTNSAALVLNFIGATVAPVANATTATVQRTGTTAIAPSVANPVFGQTYELFNSATSSWGTSASSGSGSGYGTISVTTTGFNYQVTSTMIPVGSPTDLFQYRVKYTDSVTQQPVSTAQANLTLNFAAASTGVPRALTGTAHAVPGDSTTVVLTYLTSANDTNPVSGTQYFITQPPSKGKLVMADSLGMDITASTVLTSARVKYVANPGVSGTDTFKFKVKEPVSGGTFLDSAPAEISIDIGHGLASVSPPLEEGGGGALSPLALLAMLALYGRRRLH